jgi:hypothetical protein
MIKFKAWNASKTHSIRCAHGASFSRAIAKFHNAEIDHFEHNAFIHELIRGSLNRRFEIREAGKPRSSLNRAYRVIPT